MAGFVSKAMYLVLNRGTIPWPHTFDGPAIAVHWGSIQARSNNVMGAFVRLRNPARQLLRVQGGTAQVRKVRDWIRIPFLHLCLAKVNGLGIDTRRRSRFETTLGKLELF